MQEFSYAHPRTKFEVNKIFNSHFSGQVLWDLFCRESEMVENTWNVSFRLTFNLPRNTHKFLVQPVSECEHIKKTFIKRYLNFIGQIKKSSKVALKNMFNTIKHDCLSVTGSNLRNIMLLVGKSNIEDLCPEDHNLVKYNEIPEEETWRVSVIKELVDVTWGESVVEGFSREELAYILGYASAC